MTSGHYFSEISMCDLPFADWLNVLRETVTSLCSSPSDKFAHTVAKPSASLKGSGGTTSLTVAPGFQYG